MKKSVIISLISTLLINFSLFITNLISANLNYKLIFRKELAGGECIEYIGFGVRLVKIFSFGTLEESRPTSNYIYFHPISLIIPLIVVFIIVFLICLIIHFMKNRFKIY